MNRDHDYGGGRANQLRTLEHLGVFRVSSLEQFQEWKRPAQEIHQCLPSPLGPGSLLRMLPGAGALAKRVQDDVDCVEETLRRDPHVTRDLPRRPEDYPRLVDPSDAKADLTSRARSYLHANCAQCHVTAGGGNAAIDLEFGTPLEKMGLVGVRPQHAAFDLPDPELIAPGQPRRSVLYQRASRRGPGQMPPLATTCVDREAVRLLEEWIARLKPARRAR
jgi:mono/diheme cytochrome c family protein